MWLSSACARIRLDALWDRISGNKTTLNGVRDRHGGFGQSKPNLYSQVRFTPRRQFWKLGSKRCEHQPPCRAYITSTCIYHEETCDVCPECLGLLTLKTCTHRPQRYLRLSGKCAPAAAPAPSPPHQASHRWSARTLCYLPPSQCNHWPLSLPA